MTQDELIRYFYEKTEAVRKELRERCPEVYERRPTPQPDVAAIGERIDSVESRVTRLERRSKR
jgi:polyhydroxyalkanoate synthesis regulator phasin